ncbi:MAG TPA: hypothetical protein VKU02_31170, partial [Gemmataceae bacterium]|nr:hypothetical protein [Gemmataceae bacterium]
MDPSGNGSWVAASTAAGDPAIAQVVLNCAPALSNDQSSLYIAVSSGGESTGYLVRLDSTTLAMTGKVFLRDPSTETGASLPDIGTASPTVGPDGDVYFGVFDLVNGGLTNNDRGWLLHFSSDLRQTKIPGAFGWDDTASIVPASTVPSYNGASSYLIMTKYNNYKETGGDGDNRLAVLDPNAIMQDPITQAKVMAAVLTIAGVTPDPVLPMVREWCINTAAVDPASDSIMANSEDGTLYRWNLATNSFTQSVKLTNGTGEAYTPIVIGADGTVYAINDATLFAVGGTDSGATVTPPSDQSATEGTLQAFELGSFTDTSGGPWIATVAWGDGTSATMFDPPGVGSLGTQNHSYSEEGVATVIITVKSTSDNLSGFGSFQITVSDPAVAGTPVNVNATAGSPFTGTVANFTDPGGSESDDGTHYSASIDWGDGSTATTGAITTSGDTFTISGTHTYAAAGSYFLAVAIDHEGVRTLVSSPATVGSIDAFVPAGMIKPISFWEGLQGQELARRFGATANGQSLGQWLAMTFPDLYGGGNSAPNLGAFTNSQIGSYYQSLFLVSKGVGLDAEVLATALEVFTTTTSLGGSVGQSYGFTVNAFGLAAYDWNIGSNGSAFGASNFTVFDVFQILATTNDSAVSGEPWGTNTFLRDEGLSVYMGINHQ